MVVSSNLLLITISSFYSYAILLSNTLHILSIYQLTPLNFFTILLYPSISVAFPMPNHLVITILYISYFLKSFFLINIGILYLLLFSSAIISEYKIKAQNKSNVCSVLYPFSFTLTFPVQSPCHTPIYLNFQKFFHSNVKIGAYLLQHSNLHYFTPVFVSKISIRNGNIASCSLTYD